MKGKPVRESALEDQTHKSLPNELNNLGTVHGGQVMYLIDSVAAVVAKRHSRKVCVTRFVDELSFNEAIYAKDIMIFKVSVNRAWRTSMEVGVKILAEDSETGKTRDAVSVYLTFVAIGKDGKPTSVPPVIPETPEQKRRYKEAGIRRKLRLAKTKKT